MWGCCWMANTARLRSLQWHALPTAQDRWSGPPFSLRRWPQATPDQDASAGRHKAHHEQNQPAEDQWPRLWQQPHWQRHWCDEDPSEIAKLDCLLQSFSGPVWRSLQSIVLTGWCPGLEASVHDKCFARVQVSGSRTLENPAEFFLCVCRVSLDSICDGDCARSCPRHAEVPAPAGHIFGQHAICTLGIWSLWIGGPNSCLHVDWSADFPQAQVSQNCACM